MTILPKSLLWGLGLLVLGTGPLLLFLVADALGLIGDPNPNPVGLGLLFVATIIPAMALIVAGLLQWTWRWLRDG